MTPENFLTFSDNQRPEIDYPCTWVYKVIGEDRKLLEESIQLICAPNQVEITFSQQSSKGKYLSLNASLRVTSEEERLTIYALLKNHPAIKIVL